MHNPKSRPENETHKIPRNFEIQTDHIILARKPDLVIVNNNNNNKKKETIFSNSDHRVKLKEGEKRDKCCIDEVNDTQRGMYV